MAGGDSMINKFKFYLLPMLSGFLCGACHYFPFLFVFFWFLLNPFFSVAFKSKDNIKKFLIASFIFSFSFYYSMFFWLNVVNKWVGPIAFLGVLLLCLYLSIIFSFIFLLARKSFNSFWASVIGIPLIWVLIEVVQSLGPLGISSQLIAYIIPAGTQLSHIAYFVTVYGLSLFIVMFNVLYLFRTKSKSKSLIAAVILLAITSLMIQLYPFVLNLDKPVASIDVIMVQPNISQNKKVSQEFTAEIMGKYHSFINELSDKKADLLIFPENTLPGTYNNYKYYYKSITQKLSGVKNIIIGSNYKDGNNFYNSMIMHDSKGNVIDRYNKVRLVPFGEYIPFFNVVKNILPEINFFNEQYSFGKKYNNFTVNDIKIGNSICYETIFPSTYFRQRDSGLFVAVTDDSWYDGTIGINMHHNITAYRAIESGRQILFAANTGVTCKFDRDGTSRNYVRPQESGYIQVVADSYLGTSVAYKIWYLLCVVLVLGVIGVIFNNHKK